MGISSSSVFEFDEIAGLELSVHNMDLICVRIASNPLPRCDIYEGIQVMSFVPENYFACKYSHSRSTVGYQNLRMLSSYSPLSSWSKSCNAEV